MTFHPDRPNPFSGKNVRNDICVSSAGFAHSIRSIKLVGSLKKKQQTNKKQNKKKKKKKKKKNDFKSLNTVCSAGDSGDGIWVFQLNCTLRGQFVRNIGSFFWEE